MGTPALKHGGATILFPGLRRYNFRFTLAPEYFFTTVLAHEDYCVAQVVGLVIRNTLGWEDSESGVGCRKESDRISLSQFEAAGMSRASAAKGVKRAIQCNYIRCIKTGTRTTPSEYGLPWIDDEPDYAPTDVTFDGFAAPEFVVTPNWYFDFILRKRGQAEAKVVGEVIRQVLRLSATVPSMHMPANYSDFVESMCMSGRSVVTGINGAIEDKCIVCVRPAVNQATRGLYALNIHKHVADAKNELPAGAKNEPPSEAAGAKNEPAAGAKNEPTKSNTCRSKYLDSTSATENTSSIGPKDIVAADAATKEKPARTPRTSRREPDPLYKDVRKIQDVIKKLAEGFCYIQQGTWAIWYRSLRTLLERGPYGARDLATGVANYHGCGYPLDKPILFMRVVNDACRNTLKPYDRIKHTPKTESRAASTTVEQALDTGCATVIAVQSDSESMYEGMNLEAMEQQWREEQGIAAPVIPTTSIG